MKPTPTIDGGWCLGTGGTWEYGCETWSEATLFQSAEGQLELIIEHYGTTSREASFRKTLAGEPAVIIASVLDIYEKIPDFVEEAMAALGKSEEILANASGHSEKEHERVARLFRKLGQGHRRAVLALIESLSDLDDSHQ